jgi:hypothetical protein
VRCVRESEVRSDSKSSSVIEPSRRALLEQCHHIGRRLRGRQILLERRAHVGEQGLRVDRELTARRIAQRLVLRADVGVARLIDRLVARRSVCRHARPGWSRTRPRRPYRESARRFSVSALFCAAKALEYAGRLAARIPFSVIRRASPSTWPFDKLTLTGKRVGLDLARHRLWVHRAAGLLHRLLDRDAQLRR